MKILTEEEFADRLRALRRAKAIFFDTGLTDNITQAFRAYQAVFAEREREIFLSSTDLKRPFDKYERPKCPECDADMAFRQVPVNEEGIKVQLVCMNEKCDTVLSSENDLAWWQKELKLKNEPDRTPTEIKEIQQEDGYPRDRRRISG